MIPGESQKIDGEANKRKTRKRKPRNKASPKPESSEAVEESSGLDSTIDPSIDPSQESGMERRMDDGLPALGTYQPDTQRNLLQEILTWKKLALMKSPSVQKWLKETQHNIALSKPQDLIKSLQEAIQREKAEMAQAAAQSADTSNTTDNVKTEDQIRNEEPESTETVEGATVTGSDSRRDMDNDKVSREVKDRIPTPSAKRRRARAQKASKLSESPMRDMPKKNIQSTNVRCSSQSDIAPKDQTEDTSPDCGVFVQSYDLSAFQPSAFQPGTSQANNLQLKAIRDSISKSGAPASLSTSARVQQSALHTFLTESGVVGQRSSNSGHSTTCSSKAGVARMLRFNERNQFKPVQQDSPLASPEIFSKHQVHLGSFSQTVTKTPGNFTQTLTTTQGNFSQSTAPSSSVSTQRYPLLRNQLSTPEKVDSRPLKEKFNLLSGLLSQPDTRDSFLQQSSSQLGLVLSQNQQSSLGALDLAAIFSEANTNVPQPIGINSAPASPTEYKEQLKQASQLLENYRFKLQDTLDPQNQEMDDFLGAISGEAMIESDVNPQGSIPASPVDNNMMFQTQERSVPASPVMFQGQQRSVPVSPVDMFQQQSQQQQQQGSIPASPVDNMVFQSQQRSVPASPVMFQTQQDFSTSSLPGSRGGSLNPSPVNMSENLMGNMGNTIGTLTYSNPPIATKFDNFAVPAPPTPTMGIYTKHENIMAQQEGIMSPIQGQSISPIMSPVGKMGAMGSAIGTFEFPGNFGGAGHNSEEQDVTWQMRKCMKKANARQMLKEKQKMLRHKGQQGGLQMPGNLGQQGQVVLGQGQFSLQGFSQGLQQGLHTGLPQVSPVVQRAPSTTRTNPPSTNQPLEIPITSTIDWQWPIQTDNPQAKPQPSTQTSQVPGQRVSLEALLARTQSDQQQPMSLQRMGSQGNNSGQDML